MKLPFIILLILLSAVHASDTYLLPDEAGDALYRLRQEITSAKKSIVLITPVLGSRSVRKALMKALHNDINITVITRPGAPAESAHLAQYRQVDVLIHRGLQTDYYEGSLHFSLLLSDGKRAILSPLAFDEKTMKHDVAIVEFTSDPKRIEFYRKYVGTLKARSKPYLD